MVSSEISVLRDVTVSRQVTVSRDITVGRDVTLLYNTMVSRGATLLRDTIVLSTTGENIPPKFSVAIFSREIQLRNFEAYPTITLP